MRRSVCDGFARPLDNRMAAAGSYGVSTHFRPACLFCFVLCLLFTFTATRADDTLFPLRNESSAIQSLKTSVAYLASLSIEKVVALVPVQ